MHRKINGRRNHFRLTLYYILRLSYCSFNYLFCCFTYICIPPWQESKRHCDIFRTQCTMFIKTSFKHKELLEKQNEK